MDSLPKIGMTLDRQALPGEDEQMNACFFTEGSFHLYAEGYRTAVDLLVGSVKTTHRKQDVLVYPIVFLWRQYVELRLKEMLLAGRYLADQKVNRLDHKIMPLWTEVRKHLTELEEDTDGVYDATEHILLQLDQLDPDSFTFRYPTDAKVSAVTIGIRKNMSLDNFHEVMSSVARFLDAASMMFANIVDYKVEAEAEEARNAD